MTKKEKHMVTGAYGFSGKYIAERLLEKGQEVLTLTNSANRKNNFGGQVRVYPLNFANPEELAKSMDGVDVLYNTYWVRFNHKTFNHESAVDNTLKLFQAAKEAGVKRVVHVSITNPSEASKLEYFAGKARLEKALMESGLSHAILRPAVIFGREDILINNIAWVLRKMPVFPVFGYGSYRLRPIHVDDLAELAVRQGESRENCIVNAVGPETYTYRGLVEKIGDIIGVSKPIVSVSPAVGYFIGSLVSKIVRDVMITREEIEGLMADLLCVEGEPTGKTKLSDWVGRHQEFLGARYANELARRMNREVAYVV